MIESVNNKTRQRPPYQPNAEIRRAHERLTIVDLHADSLLWHRDFLTRSTRGHSDYPRLREGNLALQVFGVVTQYPFGLGQFKFLEPVDLVSLLAILDGWPARTWLDPFQRAVWQAKKLHRLIERSGGRLVPVRSVLDLDNLLAAREKDPGLLGCMLSLEGVQALNGELYNLQTLYDLSFRMVGLAHFSDTQAGGSAHGHKQGGLTAFGSQLIRKLQELHMIIDLAHSSPRVVEEVTGMAEFPVISSHTGLRGICDNPRNLSDNQVKSVAATGGLVGITVFPDAVGGITLEDVARSMRYAADLVGVEHVGFGSDFDGAITAPVDVSGLPLLTEQMFAQGFSEGEIGKILGGNALRVFRAVLQER